MMLPLMNWAQSIATLNFSFESDQTHTSRLLFKVLTCRLRIHSGRPAKMSLRQSVPVSMEAKIDLMLDLCLDTEKPWTEKHRLTNIDLQQI